MNNTCVLVGRLTRDLELKGEEVKVARFTLAVNRNFKNKDGEYEADFIPCVCFGSTAERLVEYCKKGDMIGVKGSIQSYMYEKDGYKNYGVEVSVERLSFLSTLKKGDESEK